MEGERERERSLRMALAGRWKDSFDFIFKCLISFKDHHYNK